MAGWRKWHLAALIMIALASYSARQTPLRAQVDELAALGAQVGRLYQAGKYVEGMPLAEQYSEATLTRHGAKAAQYAAALNDLAVFLSATKRFKEAEAIYRRILAIDEANLGPEHSDVSKDLVHLARVLAKLYRPAEPEKLMRRALAIDERNFGPEHPEVATRLYSLAELLATRKTEAVPLLRRALAIDEKGLGPGHPQVARDLTKLADALYHNDDDDPELEVEGWKHVWRALTIVESSDDPAVAERLRELGQLMINMVPATGKPADWEARIEGLYRRALAIDEQALGPLHPTIVGDLEKLSAHLESDKRFAEAEPMRRRSLAIVDQSMGPEHFDVVLALDPLAKLLRQTNRSAEAVPLYRRALTIEARQYAPDSPIVVLGNTKLADALRETKQLAEAEAIYRRMLEIEGKKPYPDTHAAISLLEGLTQILIGSQRVAEAGPLVRRMLALHEKGPDPGEEKIAADVSNLAAIDGALGDWTGALALRRRLTDIFFRHRWPLMTNPHRDGVSYRDAFRGHVLAIRHALPNGADGLAESFRMAQWALENDTVGAVRQMSERIAAGSGPIAELLRERQVASRERAAIGSNINKAEFGAFPRIEERLRVNWDRLQKEFPGYQELEQPEPPSIEEAQSLLTDDEALIQFLEVRAAGGIPTDGYFAWVVTKRDARWVEVGIKPRAVAQQVQALRCGLDATLWQNAMKWPQDTEDETRERANQIARRQRCVDLLGREPLTETLTAGTKKRNVELLPFDVAAAHALYKALLGSFEEMIKDKRLIVIPDGALTSLPFNVLVTAPPRVRIPATLAEFRRIDWLGSRQALTVLPSAASLKALRRQAKISRATKAFLGIGNPLLDGRQNDPVFGGYYRERAQLARLREECPKQQTPRDQVASRGGVTRSFGALFRGANVDVEELRQFTPLPETADELCAVRDLLQAPGRDVILGGRATETTLKNLSETGQLADYKILHFATHGALAGQVEGAAEPGLILTPPPRGTSDAKALERDDGFLTSSEIATLHLDADWVILSACNTAGGNGETAEALSGMARAFFFAGARALLVSHWEVDSDAAVKLTTRAFAEQATHPGTGPALAFRNSMKALITNGALEHAHPSHWAPFVVVGEGAAEGSPLSTSSVVPGPEMPSTAKPKTRSVKKPPASSWQKEIWR